MIDFLKSKYSDPHKAYKFYIYSKNFYRVNILNEEIATEKENLL